ncbi:MAG: ComF family protein [Clostridia bacterium]|nr:ComF family protein [Clostridia bacterium]
MMRSFKKLWAALEALVYPRRAVCMGCGTAVGCEEDWICPACRLTLAENWIGAGRPPKGLRAAAYAYFYSGAAAGIVQRMKYDGVYRLVPFMGEAMARASRFIEPMAADCVTSVPMHEKRLRERGFDHAGLLAEDVAGRLSLPYEALLMRTRDTPQQARLDDADRRRNLKGAIEAKGSVAGRRILLVDDVCTTGATAGACAKALYRAGAQSVYLLCYAMARPKGRRGQGSGRPDDRDRAHK